MKTRRMIRASGVIEVNVMCDDPDDPEAVERAIAEAQEKVLVALEKHAKRLYANVGMDGASRIEKDGTYGDYLT